jgi:uncharacterized protein GlcG (DUF336 family)
MCLTAADAEKILAGCKAEAAKNKWNVSIAIVDDAGFLVLLERLDGAVGQSGTIATFKASGNGRVSRQGSGSGRAADHVPGRMRRRRRCFRR